MSNDSRNNSAKHIRHYFVDEGGDSTLFSGRGKILIDTPGCSRFFILGLLDVPDPEELQQKITELRMQILNDPYFEKVPSIQKKARKTAIAFHAKDDLPEVRKEVFTLLRKTDGLRFFAVVSDKLQVLEYVRKNNRRDGSYHYHPNELYDYLTRRLFTNLLHKDDAYEIVFSKRGKSDRTDALLRALETARERFANKWNVVVRTPMHVTAANFSRHAGLQAVDYFIWALQRLYEKNDGRYLDYLYFAVGMIQDIDDKRKAGYGVYYTQRNPLNIEAIRWRRE